MRQVFQTKLANFLCRNLLELLQEDQQNREQNIIKIVQLITIVVNFDNYFVNKMWIYLKCLNKIIH